jgi:hypothetical protein
VALFVPRGVREGNLRAAPELDNCSITTPAMVMSRRVASSPFDTAKQANDVTKNLCASGWSCHVGWPGGRGQGADRFDPQGNAAGDHSEQSKISRPPNTISITAHDPPNPRALSSRQTNGLLACSCSVSGHIVPTVLRVCAMPIFKDGSGPDKSLEDMSENEVHEREKVRGLLDEFLVRESS